MSGPWGPSQLRTMLPLVVTVVAAGANDPMVAQDAAAAATAAAAAQVKVMHAVSHPNVLRFHSWCVWVAQGLTGGSGVWWGRQGFSLSASTAQQGCSLEAPAARRA